MLATHTSTKSDIFSVSYLPLVVILTLVFSIGDALSQVVSALRRHQSRTESDVAVKVRQRAIASTGDRRSPDADIGYQLIRRAVTWCAAGADSQNNSKENEHLNRVSWQSPPSRYNCPSIYALLVCICCKDLFTFY